MKSVITVIAFTLILGGCSETWKGMKKDSSDIWNGTKQTTSDVVQDTKEAIHDATE